MESLDNLKEILLEEIALEGLDGITINALKLRLTERPGFPLTVNDETMPYIWRCVLGLKEVQLYKLQKPRPEIVPYKRAHFIDPETRHFIETEHIPEDIYKVEVVEEEGVFGSCPDYKTRKNITQNIRDEKQPFNVVSEMYGNQLVIVADQDVRMRFILGHDNDPKFGGLPNLAYCILEKIARSRCNGETSIGKRSLQALNQTPKSMFYHLKKLRHFGLLKKQRLCSIRKPSNAKLSCVLYHLKRFYQKVGNKQQLDMMAMVEELSKEPEQMCEPYKLKNLLKIYDKDFKKVSQLTVGRQRVFEYVDVPYREIHPDSKPKDYMTKSGKSERTIRHIRLLKSKAEVKKFVMDQDDTDEEEEEDEQDEEDEENEVSSTLDVTFQRMFDRPYIHQATELVKEAGANGLSQVNLQQILGCNRLAARRTVNMLLRTNHVTTVMQDRGRQKVVMYVSVENAQENVIHQSFQAEMDKYGGPAMIDQIKENEKVRKLEKVKAAEKKMKEEALSAINDEPVDGEKISQITKELDKLDELYSISNLSKETKQKKEILRQIVSEDGSLIQVKLEETYKSKPGAPVLGLKRFGSMLSESHIRRINWILEVVSAIKVVETVRILKLLRNREKEMNMTHMMDSKSLNRLVVALAEENKIRCFHAQISMEHKTKDLRYLCSREIDEKNGSLLRILEEAKLRYFSVSKEQLHKRKEQNKEVVLPPKKVPGVPDTALESIHKHQIYRRKVANTCPPMKYNRRAGLKYGLLPKMLRIQAAHQYLFHVCYDTYGNKVLSDGTVSTNQETTSEMDVTTMNAADKVIQPQITIKEDVAWPTQELPVYFDEWTWRRYLPPLPVHIGYPKGWCLLSDVLLRLPVYLFCQIVNVCYDIDGLEKILSDSKKKFYPVINLPWKISQQLVHSKKYVHSFMELCSYLCEMGLLSYGKDYLKEIEQTFVFVHKNGSVLDTRDSLRGYNKVRSPDDVQFSLKKFHFEKLSDLHDYWENLQIVALSSNLGYKSKVLEDVDDTKSFEERSLKIAGLPYGPDNVVDDGVIPGDRRGAGGLDSSLFVHCSKNWTFRSLSNTALGDKTYRSRYVPAGLKGGLDLTSKRKVVDRYNKNHKLLGKERLVLSDDPNNPIEIKKVVKENVKGNRGGRGVKRGNISKVTKREDGRLRLKRVTNYKPPRLSKKKKPSEKGDEKDRRIYGNKTKQRVVWSVREDSVLLMCRLATFIMDDNRKASIVSYPSIRDFIHEHCGEIAHDKTSQACNRRLTFVMKNKPTENNLLLYFREAMQDEYIVKNFVAKRFVVTDPSIVPSFKKLTEYLIDKFQSLNVQKCKLPATLKELHDCQKDPIDKLTSVKVYKDAASREEICKDVLRNILHSAVLLQDKQGRTHEMFKLLTQYPDLLLSEVIKELRLDGLFVMQKKHYQKESLSQLHSGLGLRNFKVSQRYMYNYKHRYLSTLFEESADFLDRLYDSYLEGKGVTLDFHPKGGQSAILIPLVLQKILTFQIRMPDELVVIDMDGFYNFPWGRGKIGITKADKSLHELYNKKNAESSKKTGRPQNNEAETCAQQADSTQGIDAGEIPTQQVEDNMDKDIGNEEGEAMETEETDDDIDDVQKKTCNTIPVVLGKEKEDKGNNVTPVVLGKEKEDEGSNVTPVVLGKEKEDKGNNVAPEVIDETDGKKDTETTDSNMDIIPSIPVVLGKEKENEGSNVTPVVLGKEKEDKGNNVAPEVIDETDGKKDTETTDSNKDFKPSESDNSKVGNMLQTDTSADPSNNDKETSTSTISKEKKYEVLQHGSSTIYLPISENKSPAEASNHSSIASRTLLSLRRAEDTATYSLEDIRIFNAQDNFVVKSCEIEVKLREENSHLSKTAGGLQGVGDEKTAKQSSNQIGDQQITPDDQAKKTGLQMPNSNSSLNRLMLHKPKMKRLWGEMQRLLPFKLDMAEVWKSMTNIDRVSTDDLEFYKQVYQIIDSYGELGMKMFDLQKQFVDGFRWKDAVQMLKHYAAVIEVGITNVRYVTLEHSRPWVIHAYRNIKGRGLHKEEELESETVPLPSSSSGVTSSADNGVAKASADDVIHIETLPSKPSNISTLDSYDEQRVDPDNPSDRESRKRKLDESDVDGSNVNAERTGEEDGSASNPKKPRLDDNLDVTEESVKPTEVEMGEAGVTVGPPSELKTRATRKRKSSGGDQQPTTKGPQPTSTYDKVRLIIQPWRKPEGGINKPILKMMLESVMLFLMMKPGSTEKLLLNRYLPYLQPMMLENIVKILEEIGCLKRKFIKKTKCSLFSKRKVHQIDDIGTENHEAMFIPTEECLFRLGQFGREFFPNAKWPATSA